MRRLSRIALPGYAVCLWLLIFPLVDTVALAIPPAPGEPVWRYSFIEVLSRSLMTPMLGVFGILLLASFFEHQAVRRLTGILAYVGTFLILVFLALFAFDSLAVQGETRPGLAPVFGGPWFAAVAKLLLALVVLFLVGSAARGPAPEREAGQEGPRGTGERSKVRRPLSA